MSHACPADQMILDVGPKSVAHLTKVLEGCQTLLWNGPLGAFEIEPFGDRHVRARQGSGRD